ncbi:sugar transferase [Salinibacterium sp. SYSU T00001]|uniref:sugar transferase n=1 Tax=Homoserinimonas sedimenticola TaxID=2986805 RepID=UPI002235CD19|nr:sugar transferase [Salinibacterium sedimenticola]MCW4385440.1 sugar transferase [Salinibacterium sedimenticola]
MTHSGLTLDSPARPLPARRPARALHLVEPSASPAADTARPLARSFRHRLLATDILIVAVAVTAPFAAVTAAAAPRPTDALALGMIAAGIATLWLTLLAAFGTRDSRVLGVGVVEYKRVISASTMLMGLLAIAFVVAQSGPIHPAFVVAFPAGLSALVLSRWGWRRWLVAQGREGHSLSRVVVVGARSDVAYVTRQIERASRAAYTVVGAVIDGPPAAQADAAAASLKELPQRHNLDAVAATAAELGADSVVVAGSPSDRPDFIRELSWQLEGTATELVLATSLADVAGPRIHLRPIEGLPLIHVEIPQFEGGRHIVKRAFDVVVSATALVLLAPLLALIALAVRLDSPGPALFAQERVGRDGRRFTMWKFRTMTPNASEDLAGLLDHNETDGVLFKMRNDPRVTRIGRLLRRHSLDELPQLWNILIGDMSVVGPRPPLPREVESYEKHVHRRLYIRPGLTGMWQINGRSDLSWEESVRLDLYYVENWSLVGDIVIMWRTLRQVSNPVGAY